MKLLTLTFALLAALVVEIKAMPEPKPAKAFRYHDFDDQLIDHRDKEIKLIDASKKGSTSSGRLFMKKFFFNKVFGQKPNPPIIPIIITGGNTPTTTTDTITTPTLTTTTNTNTDPVATGTVTNEPTATDTGTADPANPPSLAIPGSPANPSNTADSTNRIIRAQWYGRDSNGDNDDETGDEDGDEGGEEVALIDEQSLAAALTANEYVIADEGIKDTSSTAKANRSPARINLRLRDNKRGQIISVRIPAKYRSYFKNGQRVVLNRSKKSRPSKRRVIIRRKNRRRPNKNKTKRRRFISS